jgi:twitching motility protein PilT
MSSVNMHQLLTFAAQHRVSDIHFQAGSPPLVRRKGELVHIKHAPLTAEDTLFIAQHLVGLQDVEEFKRSIRDWDGSFFLPNVGRFRVNVFRHKGNYAAVLRVVPLKVQSFEALGLPTTVMERISRMPRGLVLATGATGMGKSTTLAGIVQYINQHKRAHIITIEDPIEFIFDNEMSVISQREVGSDTLSFRDALRAALRQDPDAIMVGELRDHETVDICLKAAETGHLVLATIHTPDPVRTVGRMLSYFPPAEQDGVRKRLAENLMAVISLRLLANKAGTGMLPACEIMLVTHTISECIKNPEKTAEIEDHIAKNRDLGMQTFNQHLVELVRSEKIAVEVAKAASAHPEELERDLMVD